MLQTRTVLCKQTIEKQQLVKMKTVFYYRLCVLGFVSLLLPIYTWKRLYKKIQKIREEKLFFERHNCCVCYCKGTMTGWPPHRERLYLTLTTIEQLYEPVLYFLRTARFRIDIALMIINVIVVKTVLCELAKSGVQVRLLLDHSQADFESVQKLLQAGVRVKQFINVCHVERIMHHKYAVKDYDGDNGYLVFGSLNWTHSAFVKNFEDLVFTTNAEAIKSFSLNFQDMWDYVEKEENTNVVVQAVLKQRINIS